MSDPIDLSELYGDHPLESAERDPTLDPTRYHDAGSVLTTKGQSLASLVPSRGGHSGVVVPRASADGGSLGFNPHSPPKIYVDPAETGGKLMVDMSNITPDMAKRAYDQAAKEHPANPGTRAVAAYAIMASQGRNVATRAAARAAEPAQALSARPMSFTSAPAAPAAPAVVQPVVAAPVATPRRAETQHTQESSIMAEVLSGPAVRHHSERVFREVQPPSFKVMIELPNNGGNMTNYYHDVVRTEQFLIFVTDERHVGGSTWSPVQPDPDSDQPAPRHGILVYDSEGQKDCAYIAVPFPLQFVYQENRFQFFVIEKEKSYKGEDHG